eukprot:CAMPEP_0179019958 /NCGR_PEP_ID=MMETSP0796-20121207/5135_1 /TAXON_ID=73915 /ORGANISM="Pyrodinium bahamense, Strain pbaha01" /LENGTH=119 /DNA_ID=CAMNT_0020715759 /DNA_START=58 /DNA_END=414 /DNA_ORIENTATION=-
MNVADAAGTGPCGWAAANPPKHASSVSCSNPEEAGAENDNDDAGTSPGKWSDRSASSSGRPARNSTLAGWAHTERPSSSTTSQLSDHAAQRISLPISPLSSGLVSNATSLTSLPRLAST